jgi:vitamin B12 transporter
MHPILFALAAQAASEPPSPPNEVKVGEDIVVTASREPVEAQESVSPVTTARSYEFRAAPGLPIVADLLRGLPGLSVSVSGPRGSLTQVRIRGAEANHTLLFIDGIRFNDPAAGNEPRFELLSGEGLSRVDVVRGPQSALWGSEAIGGVIAAYTITAGTKPSIEALAEYGSLESSRLSGSASATIGKLELSGFAARLQSEGFDSFDGTGDRDGFGNRSASLKAVFRPRGWLELEAVGHWVEGESEYDGVDPASFRRADTLDSTRNRIGAIRGWAQAEAGGWTGSVETTFLASANRNLLAGSPLNRTAGSRLTFMGQLSKETGGHRLTLAAEHQEEKFRARDQIFFGATDQDRSRRLEAGVVEWVAEWSSWLTTDVAIRHDRFSAFRDATTFKAGATIEPARRISLTGSYGEGIAQPTFYDLFGFFPGSFTGNPLLKPERSDEWQLAVRRTGLVTFGLGVFSARLRDEIVDVFDPATFRSTTANASGISRRRGVEATAELRLSERGKAAFYYTWLDAEERQVAGGLALREPRRARHSAALYGERRFGDVQLQARLAYVGRRRDTDFDSFPARAVTLDDYLLASATIDWQISKALEAFVRAENGFDADYQDVYGYRTQGRTVHAGVRVRLGR